MEDLTENFGYQYNNEVIDSLKEGDEINIPVSCITDRDVMPECAPAICLDEKYKDEENWPKKIDCQLKSI